MSAASSSYRSRSPPGRTRTTESRSRSPPRSRSRSRSRERRHQSSTGTAKTWDQGSSSENMNSMTVFEWQPSPMVSASASSAASVNSSKLENSSLHHCMISFSRSARDRVFAMNLREELKRRGLKPWVDEHNLLGQRIEEGCRQAIRSSAVFCCITSSVCSPYQLEEIEYAHDVVPLLRHITVLRPDSPVGRIPIQDAINQDSKRKHLLKANMLRDPTISEVADVVQKIVMGLSAQRFLQQGGQSVRPIAQVHIVTRELNASAREVQTKALSEAFHKHAASLKRPIVVTCTPVADTQESDKQDRLLAAKADLVLFTDYPNCGRSKDDARSVATVIDNVINDRNSYVGIVMEMTPPPGGTDVSRYYMSSANRGALEHAGIVHPASRSNADRIEAVVQKILDVPIKVSK